MQSLCNRIQRMAHTVVLAGCAAGCYSYSRTELNTVPIGSTVRARITSEQAARIEPLLGKDARELDGTLVATSGDTVLLQVPAARRTVTGGGTEVLHQRVSVARTGIVDVELKKLNRGRTALMVGGSAVVLAVVVVGAFEITGSSEGPGDGGGQTEFRFPLIFRVRH